MSDTDKFTNIPLYTWEIISCVGRVLLLTEYPRGKWEMLVWYK